MSRQPRRTRLPTLRNAAPTKAPTAPLPPPPKLRSLNMRSLNRGFDSSPPHLPSSRQTAPSLAAQHLQRKDSLNRRIRSKLPARKQLHFSRRTCLSHLMRTLDRTFHIRHVLKRLPEHFLLLQAVRTPIQPIHLRLLRCQTLCKSIVAMIAVVPAPGVSQNKQHHNPAPHQPLPRLWICLRRSHPLLVPLSPLFRHDSLPPRFQFLYHGLKPPRPALRAAHPTPRNAASTLPHPPSHRPDRSNRIPPAAPLSAPLADAQCVCRHKVPANSASAPASQSHPNGHTQ